jgi:hypothetical protein
MINAKATLDVLSIALRQRHQFDSLFFHVLTIHCRSECDGGVGGGGSTGDDTTAASVAVSTENVQNDVIELMTALPKDSYDRRQVLDIVESNGMNRAALLVHKMASDGFVGDPDGCKDHFEEAIECYLKDRNEEWRHQVFDTACLTTLKRNAGREMLP